MPPTIVYPCHNHFFLLARHQQLEVCPVFCCFESVIVYHGCQMLQGAAERRSLQFQRVMAPMYQLQPLTSWVALSISPDVPTELLMHITLQCWDELCETIHIKVCIKITNSGLERKFSS